MSETTDRRIRPTISIVAGTLAVLVLLLSAYTGNFSAPQTESASSSPGDRGELEIRVKMTEFAYAPDTLRIPAGTVVKLILENAGVVPHEFMAGRHVNADGTTFTQDLFDGVEVEMGMEGMDHEGMEGMDHEGMEGIAEEDKSEIE